MKRGRALWTAALQPGTRPLQPSRTGSSTRDMEWSQQVEVVDLFAARHPEYADVLIHLPNGGSRRNAFEGWRLKRAGVKRGVSDLFLAAPCGRYHGLWIEMKASGARNARATPDQLRWLERMRGLGYRAELCVGPDAAIRVLEDYLGGGV